MRTPFESTGTVNNRLSVCPPKSISSIYICLVLTRDDDAKRCADGFRVLMILRTIDVHFCIPGPCPTPIDVETVNERCAERIEEFLVHRFYVNSCRLS
jgi:hypothetical protein